MDRDLISRSALIEEILRTKKSLQKGLGKDAEYAYMSADSVINKIKTQPAVYAIGKVCDTQHSI